MQEQIIKLTNMVEKTNQMFAESKNSSQQFDKQIQEELAMLKTKELELERDLAKEKELSKQSRAKGKCNLPLIHCIDLS